MKSLRINFIILLFIMLLSYYLISSCSPSEKAIVSQTEKNTDTDLNFSNYKITFIEIGSTTCIPCQMMQPIMKQIKDSFPNDVQIIFYNLNDKENLKYAHKYMIRVIPTQIFIDNKGEIVAKHEGFFPKEEIFKFLRMYGVTR